MATDYAALLSQIRGEPTPSAPAPNKYADLLAAVREERRAAPLLSQIPGAIPTDEIESVVGDLHRPMGGEVEDPGFSGMALGALGENVLAPVMKAGELASLAVTIGPLRDEIKTRTAETRLKIRQEFERRREAYLAANPSKTRTGIAIATELGANFIPILPGGALGRETGGIALASGRGGRASRMIGAGVAGAAEGSLVAAADAPLGSGAKEVAGGAAAAGLLSLLGGARVRSGSLGEVSDDVSEAFAKKYIQADDVAPKGIDKMRALGRRLYDEMVDEFGPVIRVAKKAGVIPGKRAEQLIQQVRASPLVSQAPVFHQTRLYDPVAGDYVRTGESLVDIVGDLPGEVYRDSERYLLARRHVLDLASREEGVKVDPKDTESAQQLIDHMIEKYGVDETGAIHQLDEVAERYSAWSSRMMASLQQAGFLSAGDVERIVAKNEHYAFFSRANGGESILERELRAKGLSAELTAGETAKPSSTGRSNPVKKVTGGLSEDNKVRPLFEASAERAIRLQRLIDRQHVRNHIADLADTVPEVGAEVRLLEGGRPDQGFSVWRDGERLTYEAAPELTKALDSLSPKESGLLMRSLRIPAKILRAGATLTPSFIARNPMRDQLTAAVNSRNGYIPVWDLARDLTNQIWHKATKGQSAPIWDEFANSGASASTLVALDSTSIRKSLRRSKDLQDGALQRFAKTTLKNPLYPFQVVSDALEKATRVGEFRRARARGKTTAEAALDAAEVTLNFSRAGRVGRVWNHYEAFVNAELQDIDKFARNMKERPIQTTAKAFAYITAPALAEWAMWHDDKDWNEREDWEKALFFHVKKREDGSFVRFPKPLGLLGLAFGTMVQQALSFARDKDPDALVAMLDQISEQTPIHFLAQVQDGEPSFSTDLSPTGIDPLMEIATNRDLFFDSAVIPRRLEKKLPEERVTERQGPTVRAIAKGARAVGIPASPIATEHLITGVGAGMAQMGLDAADKIARSTGLSSQPKPLDEGFPFRVAGVRNPFVSRPSFGPGSRSVGDIYEMSSEAEMASDTVRGMLKEGRRAEAMEVLSRHPEARYAKMLMKVRSTVSEYMALRRAVASADHLPEDVRREKILQIDQAMSAVSSVALEKIRLMEAQN